MATSAIVQENLMLKINTILKKFEISPQDFLRKYNANNFKAHKMILEMFPPMIEDKQTRENIIKENRHKQIQIVKPAKAFEYKNSPEYHLCSIIKSYLYDFYETFYKLEDGNLTITNAEDFFLPSTEETLDCSSNFKYIKNKLRNYPRKSSTEVETIILPNGSTFFAPIDHETLAYWLNANGVNLHHAIRFESSESIRDFNFSSLFNDKLAENDDEQELITISKPQAEMLNTLYETLDYGWHYMQPLDKQLKLSRGFGIGKTEQFDAEGISGKNIRTLDLYLGNHFNKCEYVREAKLNNDAHSPLS